MVAKGQHRMVFLDPLSILGCCVHSTGIQYERMRGGLQQSIYHLLRIRIRLDVVHA